MEIIKFINLMNIINMIINIVLMVVIYWNIYTCFSRYIDYKNTDKDFYDIKYNKMEYHKSIIGVIISIIASITIISILYFLQN
jgi:uncharacterized protein involved in cysteine biosynthesis